MILSYPTLGVILNGPLLKRGPRHARPIYVRSGYFRRKTVSKSGVSKNLASLVAQVICPLRHRRFPQRYRTPYHSSAATFYGDRRSLVSSMFLHLVTNLFLLPTCSSGFRFRTPTTVTTCAFNLTRSPVNAFGRLQPSARA